MAVQDPNSDYKKHLGGAIKCRDCVAGEEVIHSKGREYLPGLAGSDRDKDVRSAYADYLKRALYYNTVGRTLLFLKGLAERNPAITKFPEDLPYAEEDITGNGESFTDFQSTVLQDTLIVGYGGILVDYDKVPEGVQTREEARKSGLRARMTWYPMESVFNTDYGIRLFESETVEKSEFDIVDEDRIKVLDLDEEGDYRQRMYKPGDKGEWVQYGEVVYPMMNGKRMRSIPFYPCGANVNTLKINKPPLLDLAEVSLHHYGVYADYRNGIHFTGFPQLYIAGHADNGKLMMGSGVAWTFEEATATVKYAEFTGKGLDHPEKLLDRLEAFSAKLGARMLMTEKKTAESADKVKQDSSSESSLLAGIANNVSSALTKALKTMFDFEGVNSSDVLVELNTDYDASNIEPSLLVALMKGVQSNLITHETFLYNLKRGEILSHDTEIDDEMKILNKLKKEAVDKEEADAKALSERNAAGLKDPDDELRDDTRSKTDYDMDK